MRFVSFAIILAAALTVLAAVPPIRCARAQGTGDAPPSAESRAAEGRAAWRAAANAAIRGPATVKLRDQAELALPARYVFVPQAEATRLSRSMGNQPGPNLVGMVVTLDNADEWVVFVTWTADGYVRDDEAKDLDAAAVLENLREGVVEANKDRAARGFPELEVTGWLQPPRYDAERHQLDWSAGVKRKNTGAENSSVNFNTRALGREGFLSLNLVTGRDMFARDRGVAETLLAGLRYEPGKRYADFNASTDRVAEYGLLALIGAVAAKKLGLLALIGVFVAKFAKVGLLALAGVGLAVKRFFRRTPKA